MCHGEKIFRLLNLEKGFNNENRDAEKKYWLRKEAAAAWGVLANL